MPDTTFTSGTVITSEWLNYVNDRANEWVSLEEYGGAADGVTDNYGPFNLAVADGKKFIKAPADGEYYFSAGITIPGDTVVEGGTFLPGNPPLGTRFVFALSVASCVKIDGQNANQPGGLRNVSICRETGTIPSGCIGIELYGTYATNIVDVGVYRHQDGVYLRGVEGYGGITAMFTRVYTGHITGSHVVLDGWPEARFSQCRFGNNGAGDYGDVNCTAFMKITGGNLTNAAGGPNTLVVTNCQFNQGQNRAGAWLYFKDQLVGSISDTTMWQFDSCYIETCDTGIKSDASWESITRLFLSNVSFNMNNTIEFFDLNAATAVNNWTITNFQCYGNITLSPTDQYNFLSITNSFVLGDVSLAYAGADLGSTATISNTFIGGDLTLSGAWALLNIDGGGVSGTFTNTATPAGGYGGNAVNVNNLGAYNALKSFAPVLRFGGASTGIAYSVQAGAYQIVGKTVRVQIHILLTNKGSATGTAQIVLTGLPQHTSQAWNTGGGGQIGYCFDMAGLTSPVICIAGSDTGPIMVMNLYQNGATGLTSMDHSNFTNTTRIAACVEYFID